MLAYITLKIRWTHLDNERALRNVRACKNVKGPFLISFFI